VAEAVQASGLYQACHGAKPDVQFLGDLAVGLTLPTSGRHLLCGHRRCAMRAVPRAGGAVLQPLESFLAKAPQPLVDSARADSHGLAWATSARRRPSSNTRFTSRTQLWTVNRAFLWLFIRTPRGIAWVYTANSPGKHRVNNLLENHN